MELARTVEKITCRGFVLFCFVFVSRIACLPVTILTRKYASLSECYYIQGSKRFDQEIFELQMTGKSKIASDRILNIYDISKSHPLLLLLNCNGSSVLKFNFSFSSRMALLGYLQSVDQP